VSVEARSPAERRRDTEHRLTHDIDVWVATASADGTPYLVPLSFDYDGEALLMATPTDSRPAGTWPPPGQSGSVSATPATAAGWSDTRRRHAETRCPTIGLAHQTRTRRRHDPAARRAVKGCVAHVF
jgi:hypothetical protein